MKLLIFIMIMVLLAVFIMGLLGAFTRPTTKDAYGEKVSMGR